MLRVADLQKERKALDTKLTELKTQLNAVDTLIAARGEQLQPASLNTEPKLKRKYTRTSKRRSTFTLNRSRLALPNALTNYAAIGIPEALFRIHSELRPKFTLAEAAEIVYEKTKHGLPASHRKKATISKLRNQIAGAIQTSTVPKALYTLEKTGSKYGRNAIYHKRFIPTEQLSALLKS